MLSPGAAFLLAYLPGRHVAQLVRTELANRTAGTLVPELKQAVERLRDELRTDVAQVDAANGKLADLASDGAMILPPPPSRLAEIEAWLRTIALTVLPLLLTPALDAAWLAGDAARTLAVAVSVGVAAAPLRAVAPGNPELRFVAEARARDVHSALAAFIGTDLTQTIAVAGDVERRVRETPDLAPVSAEGQRGLGSLGDSRQRCFEAIAVALDDAR